MSEQMDYARKCLNIAYAHKNESARLMCLVGLEKKIMLKFGEISRQVLNFIAQEREKFEEVED